MIQPQSKQEQVTRLANQDLIIEGREHKQSTNT